MLYDRESRYHCAVAFEKIFKQEPFWNRVNRIQEL